LARRIHSRYRLPAAGLEDWLAYVEAVEVEIHANGRAVLRHPDLQVPVEIRFDAEIGVVGVRLLARPGEPLPPVDLPVSAYVAALELARAELRPKVVTGESKGTRAVAGGRSSGEVLARPSPGKKPPIAFYEGLIAEYDELLAANHRSPVSEIARRRREDPGTVKSWLHRGRKYLRDANQGGKES
jgi:hypothetical protein